MVVRHRGLPPYRETQGYVRKIQKLVADTDAEFSLPVAPVGRAAMGRRAATSRNATVSRAARSRSVVRRVSAGRRPLVKRTSVPAVDKTAARRASSRS